MTAFYYITNKSLHCIDLKNGCEIIGIILPRLPEGFRYTEISLDDEKHMLAISSTKKTEKKSDILMYFTLFEYFPKLIFQQVLEVCTA